MSCGSNQPARAMVAAAPTATALPPVSPCTRVATIVPVSIAAAPPLKEDAGGRELFEHPPNIIPREHPLLPPYPSARRRAQRLAAKGRRLRRRQRSTGWTPGRSATSPQLLPRALPKDRARRPRR